MIKRSVYFFKRINIKRGWLLNKKPMLHSRNPQITGGLQSKRVNCWLLNYNKFSRKALNLKNEGRYLIRLNQISISCKSKKNIYLVGFLRKLQPKQSSPIKQFSLSKTISKEVNMTANTAAIAFFSFSSLFLFILSLFFSRGIFGFILLLVFFLSKDCNFRSVRFQISSKVMLWLLRLPIH